MSILTLKKTLAIMIVLLYIFVQVWLLTGYVEPSMREMAMRALGTLDAILALIFNYFFGSSDSSHTKTRLLTKQGAAENDSAE